MVFNFEKSFEISIFMNFFFFRQILLFKFVGRNVAAVVLQAGRIEGRPRRRKSAAEEKRWGKGKRTAEEHPLGRKVQAEGEGV